MRAALTLLAGVLVALAFTSCTLVPAPAAATPSPSPAPVFPPTAIPTPPPATATPPPSGTPGPRLKRGGILRQRESYDWVLLDPHIVQAPSPFVQTFADAPFGLEMDPDTRRFRVMPELVESWQVLDGRSYLLSLRRGVKFHDGSPWTASVLRWNLNRMSSHPRSTAKGNVIDIVDVEVVDEYTARLVLKAPSASALLNLSAAEGRPMMLSKAAIDTRSDEAMSTQPIGTGPFEVVEWRPQDRIIYKRFADHWRAGADGRPKPYLEGVEQILIPDGAAALQELKAGTIQMMGEVMPAELEAARRDPNLVVTESPWMGNVRQMFFNERSGAFAGAEGVKRRQAAAYAIDRQALARVLGFGLGTPACYLLAEGQVGYDPFLPCYRSDPDKARQLLQEATYPGGFDVTLTVQAGTPFVPEGDLIRGMLEAIGIRSHLETLDLPVKQARTLACLHDFGTQTSAFRIDPDLAFSPSYYTRGAGNFACLSDKDLDACIEEGRRTADDSARHEVYRRCQMLQYEQAYYIPLWKSPRYDASRKSVRGVRPSFRQANYMADLWLDE